MLPTFNFLCNFLFVVIQKKMYKPDFYSATPHLKYGIKNFTKEI